MHTLQIGTGWFPEVAGGLARVFTNLLQTLPEAGVSVQGLVVGASDLATRTGGLAEACAPVSAGLPQRWHQFRRHAARLLDAQDVSLVASHFALYTAPLGRHLKRQPLVVHFHGPWAHESQAEGQNRLATLAKFQVEKNVYQQAQRFIVLSEAFRDVLHRHYDIPLERIRIVPGGVDTTRFTTPLTQAEARERLGWPADRPIVFAVRRLRHRMGLDNLVSAMQAIRTKVPEALLLIAGTGPLAEDLKAMIETLGLQQHVRLLGFVPDNDLPLAYRAATFSVVPTVALEGFGLITIESLAAGTPVLVTPVGGLPEVVRGLSSQLILPGSNTPALVEGITEALLGKHPLPDEMACQQYVETHFTWPVIAQKTRAVYEEVLS